MRLFHWEEGRQRTGYRKLMLFQSKLLCCDCFLIDYPAHTSVPYHNDPVEGKKHYRINILLWGEDKFVGETIFSTKRIKFFRPDIMSHWVKEVSVRRIILSVGWAIK